MVLERRVHGEGAAVATAGRRRPTRGPPRGRTGAPGRPSAGAGTERFLPFLFETPQGADAVMDGPVGAALAAKLPEKGLVGLGYWELGFRQLTNSRRPVTKVDDIAGLKIRVVQSPICIDLSNTLGANAVPMPFPELYTALETGTVDGQKNPPPAFSRPSSTRCRST